jgi:hypothetical protein
MPLRCSISFVVSRAFSDRPECIFQRIRSRISGTPIPTHTTTHTDMCVRSSALARKSSAREASSTPISAGLPPQRIYTMAETHNYVTVTNCVRPRPNERIDNHDRKFLPCVGIEVDSPHPWPPAVSCSSSTDSVHSAGAARLALSRAMAFREVGVHSSGERNRQTVSCRESSPPSPPHPYRSNRHCDVIICGTRAFNVSKDPIA